MVGLKAFTTIILSIIENTSYFMKAMERNVRRDPYSNDNIVNLFINSESVKYYNTCTI